jgi:hypothetical protein
MITCHKEMRCHGHVTFATPTIGQVATGLKYVYMNASDAYT